MKKGYLLVTFSYIIHFMKTKDFKAKEAVRLRTKPIKNGNQSLYLDIYHQGQRKYEFLRLYLIPERNAEDRRRNRHTLQMAHDIRNRRLVELQDVLYAGRHPSCNGRINFLDYIDQFCQYRKQAYRGLSQGLKKHLMLYKGSFIPISDINPSFLIGFNHYLDQAQSQSHTSRHKPCFLSQGTKWYYFNILSLTINT